MTILPPRPEGEGGAENVLRTHFIQVAVLANHQNGRDTHIRQIKICACTPACTHARNPVPLPRVRPVLSGLVFALARTDTPRRHLGQHMCQQEFSSIAFQQYASIR